MSKHRVAVLSVIAKQLSVTAAAAEYGISRQHLQRLLKRYRDGGLGGLEHAPAGRGRAPGERPMRWARGSSRCVPSWPPGASMRVR